MADVSKFLLYLAGASKLLSAHFSQCYIIPKSNTISMQNTNCL